MTARPPASPERWLPTFAGRDVHSMTSNRGRDFEDCLTVLFKLLGYGVQLTEHYDAGADLVLTDQANVRVAVQAKCQSARLNYKAVQQVAAGRTHYKCERALVVTNSTFWPDGTKLATELAVDLWDGERLTEELLRADMIWRPSGTALAPPCPRCGAAMRLRSRGDAYFRCVAANQTKCRGTAPVRQPLVVKVPGTAPAPPPPSPSLPMPTGVAPTAEHWVRPAGVPSSPGRIRRTWASSPRLREVVAEILFAVTGIAVCGVVALVAHQVLIFILGVALVLGTLEQGDKAKRRRRRR